MQIEGAKHVEVIGDATLILGDCMDVLPHMDAVEMVATDSPYPNMKGGTVHSREGGVTAKLAISTTVADPWGAHLDWVAPAASLVTKAMAAFTTHHFDTELCERCPLKREGWLAWHKRNAPVPRQNTPRHTIEMVRLFKAGPNANWKSLQTSLIDVPGLTAGCISTGERVLKEERTAAHPTQKPIEVMRPLVCLVDRGETVLDPFMGTGTTGVAALQEGRHFIGIERDPDFYEIALQRIRDTHARPVLPLTPRPVQAELLSSEKGTAND